MRKNCISVFVSLLLAVCMIATGVFPLISSFATENEVIASIALRQDLSVSPQGAVDLAWDAVENAADYEIETLENGEWELIGSGSLQTQKRIEALDDGASVFVRLTAKDADGNEIAKSDVFTAYTAPAAPVINSAVVTGDVCTVSWEPVNGADGYTVYADADTRIANVQKNECTFSTQLLKEATVYVCAYSYIDGVACESVAAESTLTADTAEIDTITLGVGETVDLTAYAFGGATYLTADVNTVSIDENGIATAENPGITQVLVDTDAGFYAITLHVLAAPQNVSFADSAVTMYVGERLASELILNGAGASAFSYTSEKEDVVTVDENGVLTALKAGSAKITVAFYNGVTAEMTVTVVAEQELYFEKETLTLGVGETFKNLVLSDGKTVSSVRYSGFGKVLEVAPDATLTALKEGTVTLTAESIDGRKATCTVTVVAAPTELTVTPDEVEIGVGLTSVLSVTVDSDIDLSKVAWSSDTEAVVTVSNGTLTAVGAGTANVTATLYNGVKATCKVIVKAAPQRLRLNATAHTLFAGDKHQLTVAAEANSYLGTLTFASSDTSVLTVDAKGNVTTLKAGTAKVTVTAYNGVTAVCTYTVKAKASKVTVTSSASVFAVGMYSRMTAVTDTGTGLEDAVWTVSDPTVATLNEEHHLIGLKAGKVTVTVTLASGIKGSCTVTIQAAPSSVTLNKTSLTLDINGRERLTATVNSGAYTAGSITFSSNNEAVARVAVDGTVIAVAPGTCKITARTWNGKSASCTVTVVALPESIEFGYSSYSQTQGSWFYVTVYDENDQKYSGATFTSADTSIATVDASGLVHVKKMGTTTITARTSNGLTATCRINVSRMNVKLVSQLPNYPTGCEAASCAMLLQYYGYYYTTADMVSIIPRQNIYYIDGYPIGPDINESFVGDPTCTYTSANPGYGVFSPAVTKALQKAVDYDGGDHTAVCITDCTFNELLGYVSDGHPVIVWSTYNMNVPTTVNEWYIIEDDGRWRYFSYPRGTHVTVLCGFDNNYIYMMDPYDNACLSFSRSTFQARWNLLGNQGVILK